MNRWSVKQVRAYGGGQEFFYACVSVDPLLERLAVAERKAAAFDWWVGNSQIAIEKSPNGGFAAVVPGDPSCRGRGGTALEAVEDARRREMSAWCPVCECQVEPEAGCYHDGLDRALYMRKGGE